MSNGKVLVIGASGFIGKQVAESLDVARPGCVHRGYSKCVPLDGVYCDLADPASLRAAMRGIQVVINCARSPWGLEEGRAAARNLAGAAASTGVQRLVHMSSVAVYGTLSGMLDESCAPGPGLGPYGEEKIETERVLREAAAPELRVAVLRPGLVYGRGGQEWFEHFVSDGRSAQLRHLGPKGEGDANLIHVDDLANFCASLAVGDIPEICVANVVGSDIPTFNEYFALLAKAYGVDPLPPRRDSWAVWQTRRLIILSLGKMARWAPVPALRRLAERGPYTDAFDLYTPRVRFDTKTAHGLGFTPRINVQEGVRRAMSGFDGRKSA